MIRIPYNLSQSKRFQTTKTNLLIFLRNLLFFNNSLLYLHSESRTKAHQRRPGAVFVGFTNRLNIPLIYKPHEEIEEISDCHRLPSVADCHPGKGAEPEPGAGHATDDGRPPQ
jgi:hypothetical protein